MSDAAKTGLYVGIAVVLAVIATVARPRRVAPTIHEKVGQPLFEGIGDAEKAQSLEIVRYDEDLGEIHTFKVAKNIKTGLWTIPSHSDYPADAEDQISDAATIFGGLNVLGPVTEDASEHEFFGVLEPDKDELKLGDEGVGLLVRIEGSKGRDFPLVVGKKVKGRDGNRYVRIPGQDWVYEVEIDPEQLSTDFGDWIKKDLLELNTYDVENVRIKDYSVVQSVQGSFLDPRLDVAVSWNSDDSKWELDEFLTFRPESREGTPTKLLDTEELDKQKLDDLKYALDDLEIVDVRRKPKGLEADLRAGAEFLNDTESKQSLLSRGFYPYEVAPDEYELYAANGEVHVGMKGGVEYTLRFGGVAGTDEEADEAKLNRYLLVMASLDESKLAVPAPPEGLDAEKAAEVKEAVETGTPADDATEAGSSDEAKDSDSQGNAAESDPTEGNGAEGNGAEGNGAEGNGAEGEEEPAAEEPAAEEPTAEEPAAEGAMDAESTTDEAASEEGEQPADAASAPEGASEPAADMDAEPEATDGPDSSGDDAAKEPAAESSTDDDPADETGTREELAKEYQRELDEWKEKKDKAEAKVRELNARFADWYYVVSEDVYKKIRLSRTDLIKVTDEAKEEGFDLEAFRNLQEKGVEGADDDSGSSD